MTFAVYFLMLVSFAGILLFVDDPYRK